MPLPYQIEEREERQESRNFWNEKLDLYTEKYLEALQLCMEHLNSMAMALSQSGTRQQQPALLRQLLFLIVPFKAHRI